MTDSLGPTDLRTVDDLDRDVSHVNTTLMPNQDHEHVDGRLDHLGKCFYINSFHHATLQDGFQFSLLAPIQHSAEIGHIKYLHENARRSWGRGQGWVPGCQES